MNKKLLISLVFICGCAQPTQQTQPIISPSPTASAPLIAGENPDTNPSSDPVVSTSPTVSPSPTETSGNGTTNPNTGSSSNPISSSSPTATSNPSIIKFLVNTTFSSSSLQSEGKSISVVVTDSNGVITTSSLPVIGGEISIPANARTVIFNLVNSSNETISTSIQYLNSGSTNSSMQVNFTRSNGSSGGGGGSSSGGGGGSGTITNPTIQVSANVAPITMSVE